MDLTPEQEKRIIELENELGNAVFPVTRADKKDPIDWLLFLESVKQEKDANSELWNSMKKWN